MAVKNKKEEGNKFILALKYIWESRSYILMIFLVFIIFSFVGFFFHGQFTFLDKILEELIRKTEGMNVWQLMVFIFFNNVQSAIFGMVLGVVLGVFPLMNAVSNGVVLGYVLEKSYSVFGFWEFWRILPHGIFELPAIFIALGLGTRLGMFIFEKQKKKELRKRIYLSFLAFVLIVVPLLIIAAIIEGFLVSFYS